MSQVIEAVRTKNASIRPTGMEYCVPRETLEKQKNSENFVESPMNPSSESGPDQEKRLVQHLISMQRNCFPITQKNFRSIAYHFVEHLNIKQTLNKDKEEESYV